MLERDRLRAMSPFFATPCYGGMVTQAYCNSALMLAYACSDAGMRHAFSISGGDSLVTRARNNVMAEFLANDGMTHLVWIDADIGFQAEAIFRLLLSDFDVVAGAYPLKRYHWPENGLPRGMTEREFEDACSNFPVLPIPGGADVDADGFMEVRYAPTGFMAIKRDVLLRMIAHYPGLHYDPGHKFGDVIGANNPAKRFSYRLFDTMIDPDTGLYLSEDYAFCRRWSDMGGKVYIDVDTTLLHQGAFTYKATPRTSEWLKFVTRGTNG